MPVNAVEPATAYIIEMILFLVFSFILKYQRRASFCLHESKKGWQMPMEQEKKISEHSINGKPRKPV
jgi:hypothetical protein